jgi:hypothetical protein
MHKRPNPLVGLDGAAAEHKNKRTQKQNNPIVKQTSKHGDHNKRDDMQKTECSAAADTHQK